MRESFQPAEQGSRARIPSVPGLVFALALLGTLNNRFAILGFYRVIGLE